jgi:hypothetical protein
VRSRSQSSITISQERPGRPPEELDYPVEDLTFSVEEAFKGVDQKIITIRNTNTSCDIHFKDGVSYLVYAYERGGYFGTGLCSGTRPVEFSKESLATLRKSQAPDAKAKVTGTITRALKLTDSDDKPPAALAQVQITLTGRGDSRSIRTDDRGAFVFDGVVHGRYLLEPELPAGLRLRGWTGDVEFEVGACGEIVLPLRVGTDAPISGTVRHLDGSDVQGVAVTIRRVDMPRHDDKLLRQGSIQVFPDENGSWKADDLAPGKYVVGVNIDEPPSPSNRYAPMFYPDSPSIAEAEFFDVIDGSAFAVELRLKPALKTRKLSGVIVDNEGRRVSGVIDVRDLDAPEHPSVMLNNIGFSDLNGNFSEDVIDGRRYVITADSHRGVGGYTEPISLPQTGDVTGLVLVLKPGRRP